MNTSFEFGNLLQRKRMDAGLEIYDLAHKCQVNPVTIYRIERGASLPAVWLFARIVQALEWDANEAIEIVAKIRTNPPRKGRA